MRTSEHQPLRTNLGFSRLPAPRLEILRARYATMLATDPTTAPYSVAVLAEIDAALAVARVKGAA